MSITLSHGGNSFSPARGPSWPMEDDEQLVQGQGELGDGGLVIQDAGSRKNVLTLSFPILSLSEIRDLEAVYQSAQGAAEDATYTDTDSNGHTVRILDVLTSEQDVGDWHRATVTLEETTLDASSGASDLATERATDAHTPILLLELRLDGGSQTQYLSGEAITWNGQAYTGLLLPGSALQEYDTGLDRITIRLSARSSLLTAIQSYPPEGQELEVRRWFAGTPETTGNTELVFLGVVRRRELTVDELVLEVEEQGVLLPSYLGNAILESDLSGAAPSWIGKIFPLVYGQAKKVPAALVDRLASGELAASITSSATTGIKLQDPVKFDLFPSSGTIQIGEEKISYTGKDTSDLEFTGVTRGASGTAAAEHLRGDLVTEDGSQVYALQGPLKQVDAVYAGGELVDAGDYTVSLSNTSLVSGLTLTTITFTVGKPTAERLDRGALIIVIDMDSVDGASTATNASRAAGDNSAWTEINYAEIDASNRKLLLSQDDDVEPAGERLTVWLAVEYVVVNSSGTLGDTSLLSSDTVDLYVGGTKVGTLDVDPQPPSTVKKKATGYVVSRSLTSEHTHTISPDPHGHELSESRSSQNEGDSSSTGGSSPPGAHGWRNDTQAVDNNDTTAATWSDDGDDNTDLNFFWDTNDTGADDEASVLGIRAWISHGDSTYERNTNNYELELIFDGSIRKTLVFNGAGSQIDEYTDWWEPVDSDWPSGGITIADLVRSGASVGLRGKVQPQLPLADPPDSGGSPSDEHRLHARTLGFELKIGTSTVSLTNSDEDPLQRTFAYFEDCSSEISAWSDFASLTAEARYVGSSDGATVRVSRLSFVVDVAASRDEERDEVTVDCEGFQDDGSGTYTGSASALIERPVDVIHHALVSLAGVSSSKVGSSLTDTGAGEVRTEQDSAGLVVAGWLEDKQETMRTLLELARWGRTYFWWGAAGQYEVAYRPDTLGSSIKSLTLPDDVLEGSFRVQYRGVDELENQVVLQYQLTGGTGEWMASEDAQDSSSVTAWGVKEREQAYQSRWVRDATAAADLASWVSGLRADVVVTELEFEVPLSWGTVSRYDVISVTWSAMGWSSKKMRVLKRPAAFASRYDGQIDTYRIVAREE